jgi:hypothetical protein
MGRRPGACELLAVLVTIRGITSVDMRGIAGVTMELA